MRGPLLLLLLQLVVALTAHSDIYICMMVQWLFAQLKMHDVTGVLAPLVDEKAGEAERSACVHVSFVSQ